MTVSQEKRLLELPTSYKITIIVQVKVDENHLCILFSSNFTMGARGQAASGYVKHVLVTILSLWNMHTNASLSVLVCWWRRSMSLASTASFRIGHGVVSR